jgi:hypothetical protein
VLTGERTAVRCDQCRRGQQERPQPLRASGQRQVQSYVDAAVTEVAVGQPLDVVLPQQPLELPQVGTEPSGTATSSPGPACCRRGMAGQAGAVSRMRHSQVACCPAGGTGDCWCRRRWAVGVGICSVGVAPPASTSGRSTVGQLGDGAGAPVPPDDVDEPGVDALDREGGVAQQGRYGVGRRGHVGVCQDGEGVRCRQRYQTHGGAEHQRAGPLRADEGLGQVTAALG